MKKGRLEAFSDGVVAIIITIMVLELHVPNVPNISALIPVLPAFLSYLLSFVYIGIYWNNHHHMIYVIDKINGSVLWANLNLLFWLSLVPFVTAWMGENHFAKWPVALYGMVLIMNAISYTLLAALLIRQSGKNSALAEALGKDWKGKISLAIYGVAIIIAFFNSWVAVSLYAVVAIIWFIPDRRIEKKVNDGEIPDFG
ncbi:MAG: TMEM175 family protein [Bacteroidota bacterium]|nr:TMEM175 family protein [Bacteroidota bacterium]MDP4215916.1 TMEM175 family protein [Bacteroidota bacterium]MDP4247138.1 TMEM175 family protein [Bacteroidota bacterium]MDP4252816.1 TMEM175 family protein [Bacteroidota bacterium]MDP4257723.1 TMEM175 family protein [Bacteroidota bacterium]